MPLVTISGHVISQMLLLSLLCSFQHCSIASFSTYSSFHGFVFGFLIFLPGSFSWLCCSFSGAPFSPDCCFSWLFLWPFLPRSSWWLFTSISAELLSLPIGSSYGTFLGLLLPSFLFVIIVVFVLIDTWLCSFFF